MSVLRKKIQSQPVDTDLNEAVISVVWEQMTQGCLKILEELTGGVDWSSESFATESFARSEIEDNLPKSGLYAGFGVSEKDISCLCLASAPLAAILNKCGIDGQISNFSGIDDYEAAELDLFMMEPFVEFVKGKLVEMMTQTVSKSANPSSESEFHNIREFQKEEVELSSFSLADEHKSWSKISLGLKARLQESGESHSVTFQTILPVPYLKQIVEHSAAVETPEEDFILPENVKYLGRHIDTSVTSVRAVLDSLRMSVADCTRLEIGQVLPLPGVSLENISLEVEMRDQRLAVASGLLGIHKTRRAVKLSEDISDEFRGDVIC